MDILNKINKILTENFSNIEDFTSDSEIARIAISAEIDAINFYEQLAKKATDENLKTVLLDIAQEEKVHFGEFETVLKSLDKEHDPAKKEAEDELDDIFEKRNHLMKIYGFEMSALEDALISLNNIKDIDDKDIKKKITSIKINLKYIIEYLRKK
jgi:rubrerythrin